MPNWKKIALSGSNPEFGSLTVDNAIQAATVSGSFSGSYVGDGSSLTGLTVDQVATVTDTFTNVTTKAVTHNLGTKNVITQVFDDNDAQFIPSTITTTDINTVTVTFDISTSGRVVVAKGGHLVSGSVDFDSLANAPTLLSSSAQITGFGFISQSSDGAISSSAQIVNLGANIVSSSIQIADEISGSGNIRFEALNTKTGSLETTNTTQNARLNSIEVKSGSIDTAITALGTESGSVKTRLNTIEAATGSYALKTQISGSFTAVSASFATTIGSLTSDYTELTNVPANIVSSSTQFQTLSLTNTSTDDTLLLTTTEDSSTAGPVLTLKRNSSSPADADYLGQLKFKGENDADQEIVYAKVTGKIQDNTDGTEDGLIEFANKKAGSNVITARLKSDKLQLLNGTELEVDGQVSASSFIGDGSGLTGVGTPGAISSSAQIVNLGAGILSGSQTLFSQSFSSVTAVTASHGFGTKEVAVYVYDSNDNLFFPNNIKTATTSAVHLDFNTARTGRVVVSKGGHVVDVLPNATTSSYVQGQNVHGTVLTSTTASFASTGPFLSNTGGTVDGDVVITGNITANEYILSSSVSIVTSSFSSGSTIFGDTLNDTHLFTGSLNVTGSANLVASQSVNTRDDSSLSMWAGSQAQYDALGSYNSNTIYFVT